MHSCNHLFVVLNDLDEERGTFFSVGLVLPEFSDLCFCIFSDLVEAESVLIKMVVNLRVVVLSQFNVFCFWHFGTYLVACQQKEHRQKETKKLKK